MTTPTPHKYEYLIDPSSNTAGAHVVRLVGRNKRVLEVGCGPGSIAKALKRHSQCTVTGVEIDKESALLAKEHCSEVVHGNIEEKNIQERLLSMPKFDVLILADVLEHLYDPWRTLGELSECIKEEGSIIVSLPHVGHAAISGCLLSSRFPYRSCGLLDKTHIRFFGLDDMDSLFRGAGLGVSDAAFIELHPSDTELAYFWEILSKETKATLRRPRHSDIYQVVTLLSRYNDNASFHGSLEGLFKEKSKGGKGKRSLKTWIPHRMRSKMHMAKKLYSNIKDRLAR